MTKPSRYSNGLGPHSRVPQSSLPGDFHSRLIVNTAEGIVMSGWRPLIKGYFAVAR
jgi:hypothetical protein